MQWRDGKSDKTEDRIRWKKIPQKKWFFLPYLGLKTVFCILSILTVILSIAVVEDFPLSPVKNIYTLFPGKTQGLSGWMELLPHQSTSWAAPTTAKASSTTMLITIIIKSNSIKSWKCLQPPWPWSIGTFMLQTLWVLFKKDFSQKSRSKVFSSFT